MIMCILYHHDVDKFLEEDEEPTAIRLVAVRRCCFASVFIETQLRGRLVQSN